MDIFDDKTTIENFKRVLQYINELVDNYDITGKIDEMIQQGLEVILIQGMQFTVCSRCFFFFSKLKKKKLNSSFLPLLKIEIKKMISILNL